MKLLINWLIYIPLLACGHKPCVVTERMRLQIQASEMSFFQRVSGLTLRDGVRSSVIWEELLHIKRSQLRRFRHLTGCLQVASHVR